MPPHKLNSSRRLSPSRSAWGGSSALSRLDFLPLELLPALYPSPLLYLTLGHLPLYGNARIHSILTPHAPTCLFRKTRGARPAMDLEGGQTPEDASTSELISPIGYSNSSKCGYCGTRGQSFSYYASATSLSPQFYLTLLDRCWRRSGKLLYRPNQRASCCPHYTIRLDSDQFYPTRGQRQTINRFNKHVLGEAYAKQAARLYPRSREETKRRDNEFCLTERIHEAELNRVKAPPEPAHKWEVTLEEDSFTEEKYLVYDNYQRVVHGDEPGERTRHSFERFLCNSPLQRQVMIGPDGRKRRLGSYHQCYRLDGVLVAVGVLDLLPQCVSSVYFLYHESVHTFAPGKLGALYEIALAVEEGYRWWYPGFYIHSCPKMKYKIDYGPQYILDPDTLDYRPLDKTVLDILGRDTYTSFSTVLGENATNASEMRSAASTGIPSGGAPEASMSLDESPQSPEDANSDEDIDEEVDEVYDSLFRSKMPGIPSVNTMESLDLDHIILRIFPTGPLFETSDLVGWRHSNIRQPSGIRHSIAQLIAALGPDLMGDICLDLVRRQV